MRQYQYIAIGLGILLSILVLYLGFLFLGNLLFKDVSYILLIATLSIVLGLAPYMVYQYMIAREQKALESVYPSFLRDLAESVSSGISLIYALKLTANADYGALNKYLRKLVIWLSWGIPFPKAMERFNKYFYFSPAIRRANEILLEIYKSGGDIVKTLRLLAENIEKTSEMYKDIISQVKSKVFVIYMIFLILVAIAVIIKPIFAEVLVSKIGGKGIDVSYFKFLSFLMVISFAISSSIMAAAVVGGNIADTIKHASIMFLIGITAYTLFVLPPTIKCTLSQQSKSTMVLSLYVDGNPYQGPVTIGNKIYNAIAGKVVLPLEVNKPITAKIKTDFGESTCTTILKP
ncbi:NEQ267 [Nanoarchaeum equitans Kin4-M]|uniref:NEQ267 n=1 Tax=Nanoarchaeum equitans (strain Kin4-M) TaxID=228908 RepID=Q74NG7_NANEQ|nr:NEQ267 [Nanoarchaeum equitans Kin4-M]